ncbi:guanylate kinase [Velocimicrobium porci]|uniref:Guanylate kinase n=1 Tax=Velocimicrobium porci TaxID=2606634 RepID=A0A6L5XWZ5_9FIRM|nr:guanylate kinase [Velocimicrobium porci]MSS63067.1 guanylate kinase [Velocimicrobium porci]
MSRKGVLTIISGFSGAGKGTLVKELVKEHDYSLSISATTRKPREGEVHGREYFFLTREEFECMIEGGQLIEWTEYVGNYYGTPRAYVEEQLEQGKDVILEIEIEGALHVRNLFPDSLLLFITPPDADELRKRLISRGTETMDVINKRLKRASEEADFMKDYDFIIVNDCLKDCVDCIHQVITNEHYKTTNQNAFIAEMKHELEAFKEGE